MKLAEESYVFAEKRQTKNKVVFEAEDPKCPTQTIYVEKWSDYARAKIFILTFKPATS